MLKPSAGSYDHAYALMALDVVQAVLRNPEDMTQVVDRLLQTIRELSSARTVAMFRLCNQQRDQSTEPLIGVNPERRRSSVDTPEMAELMETVCTMPKHTILRPNHQGSRPEQLLSDQGIQLMIGFPLEIGTKRTGGIFVIEPSDDHNIKSIVQILITLSKVVAPVLENSLLIERLKHSIEERKQAETKLARAKDLAEAANLAKSTFLANMSHELRTPMNAILGFTQLMERDPAIPESRREELAIIGRSGRHLLGLINDVLDIAKIEAGHVALAPSAFDLQVFLRGIAEMFHSRSRAKDLSFEQIDVIDLPHHVNADESKLRQILINLLGNAVKHTRCGCITFRAMALGPPIAKTDCSIVRIRFDIEDTGSGIPADQLDSIFEPFVQANHVPNEQTGTGLGLAISRQYVELMGGTISAESTLGVGSLFRFEIPVECVDASRVAAEHTPSEVLGLAPNQQTPKILVVEDRDESRVLLMTLLRSKGFEVCEAINGAEAVDTFKHQRPDLVWMDMRMPVMDGLEATRRIKQTDYGKSVPVIALTAHAFDEQRDEFLNSGCDDFIRKPYQVSEIFEKIAQHLGIEYVYEQSNVKKPAFKTPKLTSTDLALLPSETLEALHYAAVRGAIDDIEQLIRHIDPEFPDIAGLLSHLVENFDLQPIVAATETEHLVSP